LAFCSRSGLCDFFIEDGFCRPQDKKEQKSTQGIEQKGIQKSGKKSALIPYLDNIETTLMKIFAETPIKSGKSGDLRYNRNYLFNLISLISLVVFGVLYCDRISGGVKKQERLGVSLEENPSERIIIDYK